MNRLHCTANGDKSDFDANKYGDLNDESLLDGRITSKEQFEEFMRYHSLNNKWNIHSTAIYYHFFYQNPIHWAELTDSSQCSLCQQQKGWYKSTVGRSPKIMESVARFWPVSLKIDHLAPKLPWLKRATDSMIFGHLPTMDLYYPFFCWQREHWLDSVNSAQLINGFWLKIN